MSQENYITKILGIKDAEIEKVEQDEKMMRIQFVKKRTGISSSLVLLGDQIDLRGHRRRHRDAKDAAVRELSPLVPFINGMHQCQFPFTIQRFCDSTGCRADRAQTVIGKVCTVSRIYANQRIFLLPGMIKAPPF